MSQPRADVRDRRAAWETSLGLNTVRTIIGQKDGTDRTTVKHLARIDPDRAAMRQWQAKKRIRDGLPKKINGWLKQSEEVLELTEDHGRDKPGFASWPGRIAP